MMMMKVVKDIDWVNVKEAVPVFVAILLMPLTYLISNGIIGEIAMYIMLSLFDAAGSVIKWINTRRRSVVGESNQVSTGEIEAV